jgi:hypothetical protein
MITFSNGCVASQRNPTRLAKTNTSLCSVFATADGFLRTPHCRMITKPGLNKSRKPLNALQTRIHRSDHPLPFNWLRVSHLCCRRVRLFGKLRAPALAQLRPGAAKLAASLHGQCVRHQRLRYDIDGPFGAVLSAQDGPDQALCYRSRAFIELMSAR